MFWAPVCVRGGRGSCVAPVPLCGPAAFKLLVHASGGIDEPRVHNNVCGPFFRCNNSPKASYSTDGSSSSVAHTAARVFAELDRMRTKLLAFLALVAALCWLFSSGPHVLLAAPSAGPTCSAAWVN